MLPQMVELGLNLSLAAIGVVLLVAMRHRHGGLLVAIERSYLPTYLGVFLTTWGGLGVVRAVFGWPGLVVAAAILLTGAVGAVLVHRRRMSGRGA